MSSQKINSKKPEYNLPFIKTTKGKITILSASTGFAIMVLFFMISNQTQEILYANVGVVLGLLTGLLPYTVLEVKENSVKNKIDENIPLFLLSLVSAVESGSSLLLAIEEAANRNYGPLTPHLKNFRANISWGTPLDKAFENFSKRIGTKLAARVSILLETSINMGGDVIETLGMIQHHVTNLQNLEKERISTLKPYIITIYMSFVTFLGLTIMLIVSFFSELEIVQEQLISESTKGTALPLGIFESMMGLEVEVIKSILFHMAIIEAVLGGIVGGKISGGTYASGVKHAIIMVILTVIAFSVLRVAEII
ncbi:type II secretion system F family protein [Nitrosopumilus piranensis]|uniref:Putative type II secretion system F domain protein n=1 Tax=Nitrosopumilus piranensis TaxID=1582439 RepID=A0A0C5BTW8_9ARCH|nr:type II secretion system F family protein [Nitrosopumilus piranensis]AJM93203.1 putative type II secretion system F domain protein [Nitrosopumilus piranensis]